MAPVSQIKISISFWAVAVFGAAICVDRAAVFFLLCAVIHELGHLFACLLVKAQIQAFHLTLFGFGITKSPVSSHREIFIAAAGPLLGLILAAAAFILGHQQVGVLSLILSAVNLTPVPPLDGDRILREILSPRAIFAVNISAIVILFGIGIFSAIKHFNFTLILFACLMLCWFFGKYTQTISVKMFPLIDQNT